MRSAGELAVALVEAFGDPDAVADLLTDDAEWWVSPTASFMSTEEPGREAVRKVMQNVFAKLFDPTSIEVTVASVVGEGADAAVRATIRGRSRRGAPYENEYAFFVRAREGRISHVWEYFDVAHANAQLQA